MAKPKPPAPTPDTPPKKTRARRLPPEVIEAEAALAAAREAAKVRINQQKLARLIALQQSLNDRLDAIEAKIQELQ